MGCCIGCCMGCCQGCCWPYCRCICWGWGWGGAPCAAQSRTTLHFPYVVLSCTTLPWSPCILDFASVHDTKSCSFLGGNNPARSLAHKRQNEMTFRRVLASSSARPFRLWPSILRTASPTCVKHVIDQNGQRIFVMAVGSRRLLNHAVPSTIEKRPNRA